MHLIAMHLKTVNYHLWFVNKDAAAKVFEEIKDSTMREANELHEAKDDYDQHVAYFPSEIVGFILQDQDRNKEITIQQKLHEARLNIELAQRAQTDTKIKMAAANLPTGMKAS